MKEHTLQERNKKTTQHPRNLQPARMKIKHRTPLSLKGIQTQGLIHPPIVLPALFTPKEFTP